MKRGWTKKIFPALGLGTILILLLAAIFAPYLAPYDPYQQDLYSRLSGPDSEHLLGRDRLGRDMLSRIIHGARISLFVGATVVGISSVAGIGIGLVSGYFGGRVDQLLMR